MLLHRGSFITKRPLDVAGSNIIGSFPIIDATLAVKTHFSSKLSPFQIVILHLLGGGASGTRFSSTPPSSPPLPLYPSYPCPWEVASIRKLDNDQLTAALLVCFADGFSLWGPGIRESHRTVIRSIRVGQNTTRQVIFHSMRLCWKSKTRWKVKSLYICKPNLNKDSPFCHSLCAAVLPLWLFFWIGKLQSSSFKTFSNPK